MPLNDIITLGNQFDQMGFYNNKELHEVLHFLPKIVTLRGKKEQEKRMLFAFGNCAQGKSAKLG